MLVSAAAFYVPVPHSTATTTATFDTHHHTAHSPHTCMSHPHTTLPYGFESIISPRMLLESCTGRLYSCKSHLVTSHATSLATSTTISPIRPSHPARRLALLKRQHLSAVRRVDWLVGRLGQAARAVSRASAPPLLGPRLTSHDGSRAASLD